MDRKAYQNVTTNKSFFPENRSHHCQKVCVDFPLSFRHCCTATSKDIVFFFSSVFRLLPFFSALVFDPDIYDLIISLTPRMPRNKDARARTGACFTINWTRAARADEVPGEPPPNPTNVASQRSHVPAPP